LPDSLPREICAHLSPHRFLFDALANAPAKRDVKIGRATHLMHLEESRYALYRETEIFLKGEDQPMRKTVVHEAEAAAIPGYDYGRSGVAHSPLPIEELRQLEETVGWTDEDAQVLQRHGDLFKAKAEQMVDSWRTVIGTHPYLAKWFA